MTKARVLLVEDNPRIQTELKQALGAMFEVAAVVATAQEAIEWLQAHPQGWELAVVDLFLKQGHGFQVLQRCAGREDHQAVVVLSNYTREPVRSAALEQGASAIFDKSLEMDQFLAYCIGLADAHARGRATRLEGSGRLPGHRAAPRGMVAA